MNNKEIDEFLCEVGDEIGDLPSKSKDLKEATDSLWSALASSHLVLLGELIKRLPEKNG